MGIDVRPLQDDLPFGARIDGVTRDNVADPAIVRRINEVFLDRGMIVFENIEPTAQMQVMLSNVFGPLKDHPVKTVERVNQDEMPGVITIRTNPTAAIVEIDGKRLMTWQPWHFDHSYNDELNRAGVLRAEAIAPKDGMTGFMDGIQVYKDFDPALRAKLEDKIAIYTLDLRYTEQLYGLPKTFKEIRGKGDAMAKMAQQWPRSLHPAIWTRDTGEKVFHLSPYGARGFVGLEKTPEGDALFQAACDEMERVMKAYYHQWKPTDMLVWDNWRMLHQACGCSPDDTRIMHRTTIKGDYGLGRWETEPTHLEPADAMA